MFLPLVFMLAEVWIQLVFAVPGLWCVSAQDGEPLKSDKARLEEELRGEEGGIPEPNGGVNKITIC